MAEAAASSAASAAGRAAQTARTAADAAAAPFPERPERQRETPADAVQAVGERAAGGSNTAASVEEEADAPAAGDAGDGVASPEGGGRALLGRARDWISGTVAFLAQKMGQELAAANDEATVRGARGIRAYLAAVARTPENDMADQESMTVVSPDGRAPRVNMVV